MTPASRRAARPCRAGGSLDRVAFERPSREELPSLYAASDAVLFPVLWEEPWGIVPLEAMAVGRPVVATGTGGSAEYLRDGENCLLFEAGNADALAAAVRRLTDPALRIHLIAGGLETAPHHTESVLNEAVEEELLGAVASRSGVAADRR